MKSKCAIKNLKERQANMYIVAHKISKNRARIELRDCLVRPGTIKEMKTVQANDAFTEIERLREEGHVYSGCTIADIESKDVICLKQNRFEKQIQGSYMNEIGECEYWYNIINLDTGEIAYQSEFEEEADYAEKALNEGRWVA